jgi:outer membrane receptor protein involved in Fe transport
MFLKINFYFANQITTLMMKINLIIILTLFSLSLFAQNKANISGQIKEKTTKAPLGYVNVVIKNEKDSAFISGVISDGEGRFLLENVKSGIYFLELSFMGFDTKYQSVYVGNLSTYLDLQTIEMAESFNMLQEVVVTGKASEISDKLEKKTFSIENNISQSGGSVLQAMQNIPGVSTQEGKIALRGNDKIAILIDGKQNALTGFGNQSSLDNIPASSIDRIEIINNPSSKYDANGNAGIINIIYKKTKQEGFNGKIGIAAGLGALWVRAENLPTIRPQYTKTPKINPTLNLNYRKNKMNVFLQADYLYTETLNKNEFVDRTYSDGDIVRQQLKRNRNTHFTNLKSGLDYNFNDQNSLSVSAVFGSEKIIDRGDQPVFNSDLSQRRRLWQFLEDELKTTWMATAVYQHKFKSAGHLLNVGFNYTFHREDEKYFYDNILPTTVGTDAFKLLSDEQVFDWTADYIKPLKYGRFETGIKIRKRDIPTNMEFMPGINSVIDSAAGGQATYSEIIPALYGSYIYESKNWEAELGMRAEYVRLNYNVNPDHPTYKSDGYNYAQPFPSLRFTYKMNNSNRLSLFYNRRVDRPNEVDIRIFPKYDDAEIIKVGNPALAPQFTDNIELGYKNIWSQGSLFAALYHKSVDGTITRISSSVPGSNLIYAIFQNVNKSYNSGMEVVVSNEVSKVYSFNWNMNFYRNQIDAFSVINQYPRVNTFTAAKQLIYSGNTKLINTFRFPNKIDAQLTAIYLAPDIIPQGKIEQRFSIDFGIKKVLQNGKSEIFINATDIFNTMVINKEILGMNFNYTSKDYLETQVVRAGYNYKF